MKTIRKILRKISKNPELNSDLTNKSINMLKDYIEAQRSPPRKHSNSMADLSELAQK